MLATCEYFLNHVPHLVKFWKGYVTNSEPSSLEGVEYWLGTKALLKDRILPMGEKASLTRKVQGTSKLEEKVVGELLGIRDVLRELAGGGG